MSSHKLNIETGRWNRTPREQRLCNKCNELEDEFHFLFECKLYDSVRGKYLKHYYYCHRLNMFKTVELITNDKCEILRNLAVYVSKAFELRKAHNTMQ